MQSLKDETHPWDIQPARTSPFGSTDTSNLSADFSEYSSFREPLWPSEAVSLDLRRPHDPAPLHWSMLPSRWSVCSGKRALDVIASLLALVALLPCLLAIAVLVGFSSPGPILFRQRRVGRYGKLFTILKFRTMRVASESGEPAITQLGDRRVTAVGRFLRRCKLDELPQFFNVLKGEMSLVGPRPKLPHHEAMQLCLRPGLTGAATLAYRCEEEMLRDIPLCELEDFYASRIKPHKASLDAGYMSNATLLSDLWTIWSTARACILRPCASPASKSSQKLKAEFNRSDLGVAGVDEPA